MSGVAAFIVIVAAVIAGATIWLLVTDPVTTALAVESGEVTPLVRELADFLYQAIAGLLGYL
jgi:multidrug resistance efflux pump